MRGVTAILFSGVIFYQHRQPSALTNPSTPPPPKPSYIALGSLTPSSTTPFETPLYLYVPRFRKPPSTRLVLLAPPRVARFRYIDQRTTSCPLLRPPLALSLPPPSTNLATVSVLNHICDAFFFPSSFFIKLDYNCIASSSCGIAGRKNGTLPGCGVWCAGSVGQRAG